MEVVLLQDVANVGQRGDIIEVKDGYAQNYLIPNKLAQFASDQARHKAKQLVRQKEHSEKDKQEDQERALKALDGAQITITEKANEQGHLFSQVHKDEIVKAFRDQKHVTPSEEMLVLEKPIKEVGTHTITLKVGVMTGTAQLVVEKAG